MMKLFRIIYYLLTRHAGSDLFANNQKHLWDCLCSMFEPRSHKSTSASSLPSSLSLWCCLHLTISFSTSSFSHFSFSSSPELALIKICHQIQIHQSRFDFFLIFSLTWLVWCCHLEHKVEHISKCPWSRKKGPWGRKIIIKRCHIFQVVLSFQHFCHPIKSWIALPVSAQRVVSVLFTSLKEF